MCIGVILTPYFQISFKKRFSIFKSKIILLCTRVSEKRCDCMLKFN